MVTNMNLDKMQDRTRSMPRSPRFVSRCLRLAVVVGAMTSAVGVASTAEAQGRVVTISEVTIVGRVQKPIAAVDVSRIQPKLTLAELRQTFTDRIERALYRAPL